MEEGMPRCSNTLSGHVLSKAMSHQLYSPLAKFSKGLHFKLCAPWGCSRADLAIHHIVSLDTSSVSKLFKVEQLPAKSGLLELWFRGVNVSSAVHCLGTCEWVVCCGGGRSVTLVRYWSHDWEKEGQFMEEGAEKDVQIAGLAKYIWQHGELLLLN